MLKKLLKGFGSAVWAKDFFAHTVDLIMDIAFAVFIKNRS